MDKAYRTIASAALVAMALLAGMSGFAEAQRPGGCGADKKLALTESGADLVIKGECTVETAGTYKFRNVNIIAGGVLRFADATIDFWAANILVESGGSLIAGSPSEPIGTNGVVTFHLYGQDQTGQDPQKRGRGITCLGDPERCGVPQDIWESNVEPGTHKPVPPAQARKISACRRRTTTWASRTTISTRTIRCPTTTPTCRATSATRSSPSPTGARSSSSARRARPTATSGNVV